MQIDRAPRPPAGRVVPPVAVALVALLVAILAIGCASGSSTSAPPDTSRPPTGAPSPDPLGSPSSGPDGAVGIGVPPAGEPGGPDPVGQIVVPKPGQMNLRAIPAELLTATVEGRRVVVTITFTTGVEPCYVLDSIVVQRGDHTFAITLRQGSAPPGDTVCIEIAEIKRTVVDLGELAPGTYTISDTERGAAPIDVTVT